MQRRRFMQAVGTASAAAGVAHGQAAQEPVKITTVPAESAAEPAPRFFTGPQFATLRRLGVLLQPTLNGRPGAAEAGAAEFLDFLIGVSPATRQELYRGGLDFVESEARRLFGKAFAEVGEAQSDQILRPLLAPWTFEGPANPRQRFLTELRADLRTATMNSKEMSLVPNANRRRARAGAGTPYWFPIDPTR